MSFVVLLCSLLLKGILQPFSWMLFYNFLKEGGKPSFYFSLHVFIDWRVCATIYLVRTSKERAYRSVISLKCQDWTKTSYARYRYPESEALFTRPRPQTSLGNVQWLSILIDQWLSIYIEILLALIINKINISVRKLLSPTINTILHSIGNEIFNYPFFILNSKQSVKIQTERQHSLCVKSKWTWGLFRKCNIYTD